MRFIGDRTCVSRRKHFIRSAGRSVQARGGAKTFVAMSALLTTTIPQMKATIDALAAAGLSESTRTLVGGAPVTKEFAESIGADGYSESANECVAVAKELAANWL